MSKWLKRRSSKSRSSRTSSNRRKSSSSHEKGMVSYQQGSRFRALSLWGCVCKDWETKKMVIVQSSFWAAFHFRIFEVCSCSAWYLLLLAHSFWMLLEAWFHADINLLDECLQIQNQANMYIKSHRFLCHPYRSWEFHDHIKYQCPGVTVPNGRRFWRALIYIYIRHNLAKSAYNNSSWAIFRRLLCLTKHQTNHGAFLGHVALKHRICGWSATCCSSPRTCQVVWIWKSGQEGNTPQDSCLVGEANGFSVSGLTVLYVS